jgi:FKBP-type peptidyl-prolyl cis-trans isomerase FkpA
MSVTAVPIQPLAKGAVLKLWIAIAVLVLAGAALAWFGTGGMQRTVMPSGAQFRTITEGHGEPMTRADLAAMRLRLRIGGPAGQLIQDSERSGQPFVTGVDGLFPGLAEAVLTMREGGHYQLWIPQRLAFPSGPPPGAPFGPDDKLFFDIEVMQIERGMAALQQLMQQQGGAGAPQGGMSGPPGPGAPPSPGGADSGEAPPGPPLPTGNGQ